MVPFFFSDIAVANAIAQCDRTTSFRNKTLGGTLAAWSCFGLTDLNICQTKCPTYILLGIWQLLEYNQCNGKDNITVWPVMVRSVWLWNQSAQMTDFRYWLLKKFFRLWCSGIGGSTGHNMICIDQVFNWACEVQVQAVEPIYLTTVLSKSPTLNHHVIFQPNAIYLVI